MRELEIIRAKTEPTNPPEPAVGSRHTYVLTFDWGEEATEGMLEALWTAGYWAKTADRFPRTTILIRVLDTTKPATIRNVISNNLLAKGSAIMAQHGGEMWVWPDKPWRPADTEKTWRRVAP